MSFVAAAATVGTAVGLSGTAAIIGGGALIGAGVGGTYSALTGDGKILDSMLTGAGIGGLGAFGLNAAGVGAAAGAGGAGGVGAGGVGTLGTAGEVAAATNTPAIAAYGGENAFAYNAAGEMVPANYAADITGATNLPEPFMGPPKSAMMKPGLTAKEMLGYGLGATTLMGLLGQPKGVNAPTDKGMIRPYEYSVAKRETEGGRPYYFEPIEYDRYGNTTKPLDTSERNYFTQNYTALPPYKAAMGGQVPQYEQMPAGGLAAIQGMRDGYSPMATMAGNIPQFSNGGQTNAMLNQMQQMKFERDMPDEMRDYLRAKRMGLLEGGMMGEEQAKLAGGKMPEFMFAPSASQDLKNINAMAMLNKDLDEETKLKLMATGYSNPNKKGVGTYGAGLTRKLDKDSDLSAFFEQSPDRKYQSYGARYNRRFNEGGMPEGDLGGYSDGGRLLRGPGDGVSDSIPASINNKQPARLADGEFVIPARIVSELGNGSTDAGAKRLYEMMDRIQNNRKKTVGKGKVAVDSKAKKHLPA
jgi:hypothetical protein